LNTSTEKAKILIWDIESTGLKGDFATVLCVGYKWFGEKGVKVISITDYPEAFKKDPTDDKRLIKDFMKVYNEADMTIAYFGTGFDRKMLYTKLLEHRLPIPANIPLIDLFYTVKGNTTLSRKRLATVAEFLELPIQKTPVLGRVWKRAMAGHAPSIKYIIHHCKADVLVLEEAYVRLRPLVRTHPRVAGSDPCRYCGSNRLQRRGLSRTALAVKQRVQCQKCSGWDTRAVSK
jgi:Predicted exonuclease